ncbi:hypothetical protein HERIO_2150 [Hepatospora eriocheir]|uniref:Uncharacterized protein n=1 Tax=Hepatospora eriocheir TaxID=1081669 RepID=A0A1X0Q829_9MICR|nr:hypothetical protein HERIO_2150 [Hepatospora eriocheir]
MLTISYKIVFNIIKHYNINDNILRLSHYGNRCFKHTVVENMTSLKFCFKSIKKIHFKSSFIYNITLN